MSEAERPMWVLKFQAEGTRMQSLKVDGLRYSYTLLSDGVLKRGELPYVVGYDPLVISQNVPENFRSFILGHEIRENNRFANLADEERCKASLIAELEAVAKKLPDSFSDYVAQRLKFFEDLIRYHEDLKAKSPNFIEGLRASRNALRELRTQFPS